MSIQIKINGTDRSSLIDWSSVQKQEMLGKQPTTLQFNIRNYPSKTYLPSMNDVVTMYDGANLIFAGTVSEMDNVIGGLMGTYTITARDYLALADSRVIAKTYTSQTITQIVTDFFTTFISGFTVVHVNCPITLDSMQINYLTISQAMQKLMQAAGGGYDWYIDFNKDVHVFQTGSVSAPFALDDVSGNHVYDSMTYKNDFSQLQNSITVRGTNNISSPVTNNQVADGKQIIFPVGYFNQTSFTASKALAATPTTFVSLNVGKDGVDNPASFDCLYNSIQGILIFPTATKPASGDVIQSTGTPSFPVISQVQDPVSIAKYGEYDYVIVDQSIASKVIARNKAQAQLLLYSNPIGSGTFRTSKSGLVMGQVIVINCPTMGISGVYKIQQITTTLRTPSAATSDFWFDVQFVSTTAVSMVDVLNRLLLVDPSTQTNINAQIIDNVFSPYETITTTDVMVANGAVVISPETVTVGESFTNNGLNFGTIFVAGSQLPSTTKRQFILNGSRLG